MKAINTILDTTVLTVDGSLWLESNGKRFFGPGPIRIRERNKKMIKENRITK